MKTGAGSRKALQLCLLAGANYLLFYGLGVFLARTIGVTEFGRYSVAVATFTMLASVSTLGLEKFALSAFPGYVQQARWDYARGFARFSLLIILAVSAFAALAFAVGKWWSYIAFRTDPVLNISLFVTFVSCMSLFMFLVELLSANGNAVRATVFYRLLLPLGVVILAGAVHLLGDGLTARKAVLCYGASWMLCLAALLRIGCRDFPREIWQAGRRYEYGRWLRRAAPFLLQSFMMTQFASSGVIVLEAVRAGSLQIALYAASLQVAGFAVLLATATNRFYAPVLSVLLEHRDWDGIRRIGKERSTWINPTILAFLAVVLVFGRKIMSVYGAGFEEGYGPLCILSLGVAVSVRYAMAPYGLQFVGKAGWVLGLICAGGALNLGLLAILGGHYGAMGAALAYSTSLGAMSAAMHRKGMSWMRSQEAETALQEKLLA
jgi:O-antigen/teichoic acid export membrane protein